MAEVLKSEIKSPIFKITTRKKPKKDYLKLMKFYSPIKKGDPLRFKITEKSKKISKSETLPPRLPPKIISPIFPSKSHYHELHYQRNPNNFIRIRKRKTSRKIINQDALNLKRNQKNILLQQIDDIHRDFGEKLENFNEPRRCLTNWDYVCKDIVRFVIQNNVSTFFLIRQKNRIINMKKVSRSIGNLKAPEIQKACAAIAEERRIRKIAEVSSKIVQKEFWRSVATIDKFIELTEDLKENQENQRKKLESLIDSQLKLSSKLAKIFQNNPDPTNFSKPSSTTRTSQRKRFKNIESSQIEFPSQTTIVWTLRKTYRGYRFIESKECEKKIDILEISKQPFLLKNTLRSILLKQRVPDNRS